MNSTLRQIPRISNARKGTIKSVSWPYESQTPLLSGRKLVKIFEKMGYRKIVQRGSPVKVKNDETGSVVIIPNHKEVDRWTLKTILQQAEITEEEFQKHR